MLTRRLRHSWMSIFAVVLLLAPQDVMADGDEGDDDISQLMVTMTLRDGSVMLGAMGEGTRFDLETAFGKLVVPLKMVRRIAFGDDLATARVEFRNDDVLTGVFHEDHVELDTLLGQLRPALRRIQFVDVVPAPDADPLAPGQGGSYEHVRVRATQNQQRPLVTMIELKKGERFILNPHPEDGWTGGGTKTGIFCNYMGYADRGHDWMRMKYQIGEQDPVPVVGGAENHADVDGILKLFCYHGKTIDAGQIRVFIKVLK